MRNIETLPHVTIIAFILIFLIIAAYFASLIPVNFMITAAIAIIIIVFVVSFMFFGEITGILLVTLALLVFIFNIALRDITASLFYSSIVLVVIIMVNVLKH
ncbi:MAG: hypothetical protein V1900_00640 [Candidatus Aenigmatarchaeota archaeon]